MIVNKSDIETNWVDPDDAPELTDEWFAKATLMDGEKAVRRGRPAGSTKQQVAIRLDQDVIAHFKAMGSGWQTRINAALKEWVASH